MPLPIPTVHKCTDNEGVEHELNYKDWERWHIKNGTAKGNSCSGIAGRNRKRKRMGYTLKQVFGFEDIAPRDYSKPVKHHDKCEDKTMPLMRSCLAKMARV